MHGRIAMFLGALLFLGCGGDSSGGDEPDASTTVPDARQADAFVDICGDGKVTGDEECDDANSNNDDDCNDDCTFTCGDGVLLETELCDTGIAAGEPGACPTDCDDDDACTQDTLSGTGCQTECVNAAITDTTDGDGCCPPGGTANNDSDCVAECGNGVVEAGEACDTAIAAGDSGACPTDCDDSLACTADSLSGGGTCQATCSNTPIVDPIDDDGCCPSGATIAEDNDCSASCGDGVVTAPETCDTAIAPGDPGACPSACNDGNACTNDTLLSAGTCNATCSYTAITTAIDGDGCCPAGANANTDSDCQPVCGNDVVEMGEECDDGGTVAGDGCDDQCQFEAIAYRMSDMDLRDPHVYVDAFGCRDVTDNAFFGFSVNGELQTAIQTDDDSDGFLDLSLVLNMDPATTQVAGGDMDFVVAECTAPMSSTTCTVSDPADVIASTFTNMSTGTCLGTLPNTVRPYSPAVIQPAGPCFLSDAETITLDIGDIPITLSDARIAATWSGSPPDQLLNGLVRGFISEEDADATILPDSLAVVGGQPLSSILPGGTGNCAGHSDMDTGPNNEPGWYFYLNFSAVAAPYTEMLMATVPANPILFGQELVVPGRTDQRKVLPSPR
jgi:cysteine-rich repeat protein